jgi:MoxR-like ATPase
MSHSPAQSGPATGPVAVPASVDAVLALLRSQHYVADRSLATLLYLALRLHRPVLLEGEAGVGKTEVARVLAAALGRRLIRLQCYEGLDLATAAYEWDYARQLLAIRIAEATGAVGDDAERLHGSLYAQKYLIRRPLLQALEPAPEGPPVLLIDELDRADEPFEAFLLEVLSDFQVTVPELGVVRAAEAPIVLLTSNRTREIHDALKRRCFYHFIDYPDAARELLIVQERAPQAPAQLSRQVVEVVQRLRSSDLFKPPGVAETLDWVRALVALDHTVLEPQILDATLGIVLKYQDDIGKVAGAPVRKLLADADAALAGGGR